MADSKKNLGMESYHQTVLKNREACNELLIRLRNSKMGKKKGGYGKPTRKPLPKR
jgi:hypothetical protein